MIRLTIDFETSSDVSIPDVGAWMYSRHPSTDVMCVGWGDGLIWEGQWKYGDPLPYELFSAIEQSDVSVAHNAFFETCIWVNVCVKKYGWPEIPQDKWQCSASKASACSMPRALDKCGILLGLDVIKDDKEGRQSMMKLSRGKGKDEDWPKMLRYNMGDIAAEVALDEALPDLTPTELAVWRMSERMNLRGFHIDKAGCTKAVQAAGLHARRLTDEFQSLTGIESAGQRIKFLEWLAKNGTTLPNTQAGTFDAELKKMERGPAYRAIEIVREIGRSSITKYRSCLEHADTDHRVRGCFLYGGAHTLRWAGKDVQPQNFKRDCPYDMDAAWRDVLKHDLDTLEVLYGPPLEFLGSIVRGAITARPGTRFMAGDYAQIEARVLFWLAGEKKGLGVFARGEDMYIEMASTIWGRVLIKCKENESKRFIGKHAVLGLGFGAGYITFLIHLRELGAPPFTRQQICEIVPAGWRNATLKWILTEGWADVKRRISNATRQDAEELVLTKWIVDKYRKQYKNTVVKFWYDVEDAAWSAISNPGKTYQVGKISFTCGKKFLNCRLPSGRIMRYLSPKLEGKRITYIEQTKQFRIDTYGGKLVENIVQAASRDIMAENMLKLEEHEEYKDIVLTIHDEVVTEVKNGVGNMDEFTKILAARPKWCPDLPVKVESWQGLRYKKG